MYDFVQPGVGHLNGLERRREEVGRGCGVEEEDLRCCGPFEEEEDGPAVIEDDVEACDCAGPVEPDAKAEEGDPERECAGVVRAVAGSVFDPP